MSGGITFDTAFSDWDGPVGGSVEASIRAYPGLRHWFRFFEPDVTIIDGKVAALVDLLDPAVSFVQAVPANRAELVADAFNGYPAGRFIKASPSVYGLEGVVFDPNSSFSIIGNFRRADLDPENSVLCGCVSGAVSPFWIGVTGGAGNTLVHRYQGLAGSSSPTVAFDPEKPHWFIASNDGAYIKLSIDGGPVSAVARLGVTGVAPLALGNSHFSTLGGNHFDGDNTDFLICNTDIHGAGADEVAVRQYFAEYFRATLGIG